MMRTLRGGGKQQKHRLKGKGVLIEEVIVIKYPP